MEANEKKISKFYDKSSTTKLWINAYPGQEEQDDIMMSSPGI
jgi:hypothetical protein